MIEGLNPSKTQPTRERKNVVCLCKAIMKYAEGPGEIDSLVQNICDKLGDLAELMKEAHFRALEELERIQELDAKRQKERSEIPRRLLREAVLEYYREHPNEIPEGWGDLPDA